MKIQAKCYKINRYIISSHYRARLSTSKKEVLPRSCIVVVNRYYPKKSDEILPMTIIKQPSLLAFKNDIERTPKCNVVILAIDMDLIYSEINKNPRLEAPTELKYAAIPISIFIRFIERNGVIKK